MFDKILSSAELRVLGSLIEKEETTPEYYPLTLNALLAACNQKSNRWPITSFSEAEVSEALHGLRRHRYAAEITGAGMRVPKYAQRFTETLNLGRRETAILCVLMLRGPQTLGEIKDRTERLHAFSDLNAVEAVLTRLAESGMVAQLTRMPGQKEPRFAQLLGGPVDVESSPSSYAESPVTHIPSSSIERIAALEEEISRLRQDVAELRRRLEEVL